MLTLTELGYYKIMVRFVWPRWVVSSPQMMYLDGLGFYHVQLAPSKGAKLDLGMALTAEIARHAAS